MVTDSQYLFVVIALLTAAVLIVTTFRTIKISPVLGYFVAGAAIGQYGFNLIPPGKGLEIFVEVDSAISSLVITWTLAGTSLRFSSKRDPVTTTVD